MRIRLAVVAAGVALAAGCGSGGDDPAPTSSAASGTSGDPVAYMDKVCSAASSFVSVPKTPPKLDVNDPVKLKADMSAYMGQMADAFTKTSDQLRKVGPSPVAGGDEQVSKMATTFSDIATSFSNAKASVEQADANDPVGGLQAAGEAITRLDQFAEPLKQLEATPELREAAEKAPACQALRTLRPSTPVTPTS
ncbi:hypothetical protein FHS29_003299 [Saccharothrix tamanrassetensis]|uniref:Small secreted protein n=1 Tax=Saccharothrix tamanrassetensis TaxID=1051531 RepID=A0A841CIA3_9PSEU|nr:hypothetical protein [Saccharothrix tamanrassetensis]MBB5956713.1 hypothetical protein [Saccharothrix tamanrassetensis]